MYHPFKNDQFIRALLKQPVDYTPVWLMRQAGRYLPEYRATRKKAGDFLTLCKTPELACEVTLQPLQRFPLDAAILFSDILTIPDAMGLGLQMIESEGPRFERVVRTQQDVDQLPLLEPDEDLAYVMNTIPLVKQALNKQVPLIGFSGSPWTLACYMVEGGGSRNFTQIKTMMYQTPQVLHQLLDKLAEAVINYLNAQIRAGVDVVMLFDTWGGILTTAQYQAFSLYYMEKILQGLVRARDSQVIPNIVFTKGGGLWLEQIANVGYDAVGLDWTVDLSVARARIGYQAALQGNLDPCALYASPDQLREAVKQVINQYGRGTGHVFNLGHGMLPDMNPDHVAVLVDTVHECTAETIV